MARPTGKGPGAQFRVIETAETKKRAAQNSLFGGSFVRDAFDWEDVDAATLTDGIAHSLSVGRAITLSLTADGGAVKVSVWENNAKHQAYAADASTFNDLMGVLGPPETDTAAAAD